ncbi:MAG: sodium:alanine symporter family protein [Deltaproteobacteria bacterium]|nr:sodium:alanine symporter family protein [Deltaproteobacteria bacterium]
MEPFSVLISKIDSFVWGPCFLIPLLVGGGIFMTFRLKLIQVVGLKHAWECLSGRYVDQKDSGEITPFQALTAALSATIGTGNIAGVATAIAAGGPGAVFWMWITAVFGMSLKYAASLLAVRFRKENPDGTISGGPMHFITIGLGKKWLGWLFALFTIIASFGIGNMVQANSVATPLYDNFHVPKFASGLVMAFLTGIVIIGGIQRIAKVAQRIVPFMALVYVAGSVIMLVKYYSLIPETFMQIFYYAFNPHAAAGGFLGSTVAITLRFGIARGVFSNESGLGSAPIAHAAARTREPVRQGLVAMLGPLIDTLAICTMTALVILVTGAWTFNGDNGIGLTGATLSSTAFDMGLPGFGKYVVTFGLAFFAYSTVISWSYYGDRGTEFIFGARSVKVYRIIYTLLIPLGATVELKLIWNISDITNALMAIPNMIGVLLLSGVVARLTREYFSGEHKPLM